jgi:putative ABC transport system permease protein
MQVLLTSPMASPVTLKESLAGPSPLPVGQTVTITLSATNDGKGPATGVIIKDELPAQLTYVLGTTALNGRPLADLEAGSRSEDDPRPLPRISPIVSGLNVGTLAPGAAATVTYAARAVSPIAALQALPLKGTAVSREAPDSSPANAPRAVRMDELKTAVARVPGVTSADRLTMLDLPAGSLQGVRNPVRIFGFDQSYVARYPSIKITDGSIVPGSALISAEAAKQLGARPGATIRLNVPGRIVPLSLPVSGVGDFSLAEQPFASRLADNAGDFVYVPHSVVVTPEFFDDTILPALRADAASVSPVLKSRPFIELDALIDRSRLNSNPAAALTWSQGARRTIERIAPGQIFVIDNLSTTLRLARGDAVMGKVMFLFLGLPGVLLAAFLSGYAGSLLIQAQRREQAILRSRGAQTRHLLRLLTYKTIAVAVLGSVLGLGLGVVSLVVLFGRDALTTAAPEDLLQSALLAVVAGMLATALALYFPSRRALSRQVVEERREVEIATEPGWLRLRLDLVLLAAAAVVETVTYLAGGFKPTQVEGQSVSLSFYVLLAPLLGWFGATLLAARMLLLAARGIPSANDRRYGSLVGGTLRRSLKRRSRSLAAGIIGVGLALALGISVAVFVTTYHAQKEIDARFIVGSDIRVTPSVLSPQPATFAGQLEKVPGVVRATPVVFHIENSTLGTEKKDMAAVDAASLERTGLLHDSFFLDSPSAAAALARLRAEPAGLLINWEAAKDFGVQVGDQVKVQLVDVFGHDVTVNFRAVGRHKDFPGFKAHVDLVVNLPFYQSATGRDTVDFFFVKTADSTPGTVERAAEAIRTGVGKEVPLKVETSTTALHKDQSSLAALNLNGLGSLDSLYMVLMSGSVTAIFVFGLLLQRRREYVTMRALGIRMRQLRALIVGEAALVAIFGLIIGVLVGTGMAYLFVQILRPLYTLPPNRLSFPLDQMAILAGLVLGGMVASALIASIILRRLRPMEILREE